MHISYVFFLHVWSNLVIPTTFIGLSNMIYPFISFLGNLEEQTLSGTVHIMTPNTPAELSQHADAPEQNQLGTDMAVDITRAEIEDAQVEETTDISTNGENDDPLSRFLPPPVTTKCSAALKVILLSNDYDTCFFTINNLVMFPYRISAYGGTSSTLPYYCH
jgi:hypothetical protein